MWLEAFPFRTINAINTFYGLEKVHKWSFLFSSGILDDKSEEYIVTTLAEIMFGFERISN